MSSGMYGLGEAIKKAVDERIKKEARAKRGQVRGAIFYSNSGYFPARVAVECNTNRSVWAQRSIDGSAIIIGQ